mgnify:FL=1
MPRAWNKRHPMGEMEMVAEYVSREYPAADARLRVRLGTIQPAIAGRVLTPEESRALRPVLRWADAIAILPAEVVLIEAKIRAEPGAIAQLEVYRDLFPLTAELQPFLNRPLTLELVCAIEDPAVTAYARTRGIRVKVYRPSWLQEYLAKRARRETRPPRLGGLNVP